MRVRCLSATWRQTPDPTLMKTKDTRKETKKLPTKTAKEKKLAKLAKKNAR